jgi:ketosteroid isomerase-like protein
VPIQENQILDWLDHWESLINRGDYESARPLFSDDVVSFGTVTGIMKGRADLETRQWRQVWYRIKDFRFDKQTISVFSDNRSDFATIACLWYSLGQTRSSWYERRGRVTLVLEKRAGLMKCVHSHFSMEPGVPATADT